MFKNIILGFVVFLAVLNGCATVMANINVSLQKSDFEINTVISNELTRYFDRVFIDDLVINGDRSPDIVLGTPAGLASVQQLLDTGALSLPQGDHADQGYTIRTINDVIYVTSPSEIGVLYGLYQLLEEYGVFFQISGERLPKKTVFKVLDLDMTSCPVFRYRGLLPWDNFACGMSAYSLDDYKMLIDRAVRMKLNMLQFHFYPGYAFFTEEWNGKKTLPSCIGQPVDVFPTKGVVGEGAFGDIEMFGCQPYIEHMGDPAQQAVAVQDMFRSMIDYAHSRNVKVVVGFELMLPHGSDEFTYTDKPGGYNLINPLDPKNVDLSVQRYQTLLNTYPNADYYWLWQSEARGVLSQKVGNEPGAKAFRQKYHHWAETSDLFWGQHLGGDIDYAYLFKQVAELLPKSQRKKLATGGWSIEHLFPNIHRDIPDEIIFASLNTYSPRDSVKEQIDSYAVAEKGRRTWMIDWWEFDGDQWFPQFRVNWQEQMYDKCADFGVEAVTLLGWKLSGTEHNVRYLSEYCWNPELRGEQFYANYIQNLFGTQSKPVKQLFMDYDRYEPDSPPATAADYRPMLLGAGWSQLLIPELPGTVELLQREDWKRTLKNTVDTIRQQHENLQKDLNAIDVFNQEFDTFDDAGRTWARTLINRFEFRTLYLQSMIKLNEGIVLYDAAARTDGIKAGRSSALIYFDISLEYMQRAIEKYAERIDNTNDLGVIAQLNKQVYGVIKGRRDDLAAQTITYARVDWDTFELRPTHTFKFSKADAWAYRDGKIDMSHSQESGRDLLKITIGGDNVHYNSVTIVKDRIDLEHSPFVDFMVRTDTTQPLAFMFQIENSDQYYALNLIGSQKGYIEIDTVSKKINDAQWHRVTWNLLKLYREKISAENKPVIQNIIFGTWEPHDKAANVEFKDFALGIENTLD